MHLPDGILSVPVSAAAWVASAGAVGAAVKQVSRGDEQEVARRTLLAGVLAAFVFVAQMFNFPISGGTTGHLLGAALVTALVGPWRGILVMAVVFLIQTFVFADGGVLALGANLFNMGVAGCLASGLLIPSIRRLRPGSRLVSSVALAVAAWVSVELGALLTALLLAASGTVPAGIVLPAMLGVHAVIGLGEAALSVAAFGILGARGMADAEQPHDGAEAWRLAAVLSLGLLLLRLAAPHPDGLEYVAEQQGFAATGAAGFTAAPLPDYALPEREADGFDYLGSYLSATAGIVLCGGLMLAVGGLGRRR